MKKTPKTKKLKPKKTARQAAKTTRKASSKAKQDFALQPYLEPRRKLVEQALEQWLPRKDYFPAKLHSAIRHSLFSGGKRLRAILVMAAAEACGIGAKTVLPAACALECIHTYSLIHDDLPAMDNDDLRRGKPTCHKIFGEAAAILAGDALLTFAFELLARADAPARGGAGNKAVIKALQVLAQASGMAGMVGGQMADIDAEGQEVNIPMLQYIHTHKTGRLIEASVRIGAILAGASPEQEKALHQFGDAIGLAFQITDDILNVSGSQEQLGKNVGTDSTRGKATYPALYGVEESQKQALSLMEKGLRALAVFGKKAEPLQAMARFIIQREV